ncbi:hypothetical protein FN976_27725 [Caenimonas sedimenti]|uniref:Uncharacterized protein n=1 Tax=Caenimonas sedimenti TaxID=2596921 RepID=A0A562ZDV7_9BURK|nr:hypothetical protein [Caenimonas sedimenti]TWO64895.1 hypothetical protein FN976_27725 [Caenimonas sedimenti]
MRLVPQVYWGFAALAVAALLAFNDQVAPRAAGPSNTLGQDEVAQLLPGTWLREYGADAVQARRVLQLAADGGFRETVRATGASGETIEHVHEGTWLYDGTNLKRKYTLMNGRPPSRLNLPFATFQIAFETRNEFVGTDHIHRNRIRYRRVADGTQP